jgi:hypothetical protein
MLKLFKHFGNIALFRVNEVEGGCSGSKVGTVELGAIQWEGARVQCICYTMGVRVGM